MPKLMSNIEILLVRACKVADNKKRLRSLYRRKWSDIPESFEPIIINSLARICDEYLDYPLQEFIDDTDQRMHWANILYEDKNYREVQLETLIYTISSTDEDELPPEFVSPAGFCNKGIFDDT